MTSTYRQGPRIGRGGTADVHLAVQDGPSGIRRLVVTKRIRKQLAARREIGRALLDEARVLARLDHPNIVRLLDLGDDRGSPFLVVEYLAGETLLTVLRELAGRGARIPWPVVCRIGADLAAGLEAAHGTRAADGSASPIFHRDLTPSNVILCRSGAVKLIDFGIAKDGRVGDTRAGTVKGKLSYLAPELFGGGRAGRESDLWQLGVVLHEAASGQRLFEAGDDAARVDAVLRRPIPRLRMTAGEVPFDLEHLVQRLLARDPAERPTAAGEVRCALEEVMRSGGDQVSSHGLGDWLRTAVPHQLARRERRERDCLRAAFATDDTVVMAAPPVARRWKRMTAIAALAVAIVGSAAVARSSSEPRRRLAPEVCEAERRPALTSLAVPEPVRDSARRAESAERDRQRRRDRQATTHRWVLVLAAAAAATATATAIAATR
jgi:serine/threonine-protein kinase